METVIDLNAQTVSQQDVWAIAQQAVINQQAQQQLQTQTQVPVQQTQEPTNPQPIVQEQPAQPVEENLVTIGDIIDESNKKEELEAMRLKDQQLSEELSSKISAAQEGLVQPENPAVVEPDAPVVSETPIETNVPSDGESDELDPEVQATLEQLAEHSRNEIQKANTRVFELETQIENLKTQEEVKVSLLKEEIIKLQSEVTKLSTNSIPSNDDQVMHMYHLRKKFQESPESTEAAEDLQRYYMTWMSTFSNVPLTALSWFIKDYRNQVKQSQDALAWWFSRTGWSPSQIQIQKQAPSNNKTVNQNLLK